MGHTPSGVSGHLDQGVLGWSSAVLVRTEDHRVLIDTGSYSNSRSRWPCLLVNTVRFSWYLHLKRVNLSAKWNYLRPVAPHGDGLRLPVDGDDLVTGLEVDAALVDGVFWMEGDKLLVPRDSVPGRIRSRAPRRRRTRYSSPSDILPE
jgi:hypothetical protein